MSERVLIAYETGDKRQIPLVKKEDFEYEAYQVIPDRFIENGKGVEGILDSISAMREPSFKFENKSIILTQKMPLFYEILIKEKRITFNYIIPEKFSEVMKTRIGRVFKTATLKRLEKDYFEDFRNGYYTPFYQKNHFIFSLNCDYRENSLIDGILGMVNNIRQEDEVLVQIGISPLGEGWKDQWKQNYLKHMKGEDLNISHSVPEKIMDSIFKLGDGLIGLVDMTFVGKDLSNKKDDNKVEMRKLDSIETGSLGGYLNKRMTMQKIQQNGFEVQMRLYCSNPEMTNFYTKILDGVMRVVDGDQRITYGGIKRCMSKLGERKEKKGDKIDFKREFNLQVNKNIFGTKELSIFMQLPNRRMQMDYKDNMASVEGVEVVVPKELKDGVIPIGFVTYKGVKFKVFWNTKDYAMAPQHKVITGLQRTGKSSYIKNFAVYAMKAGHSVFIIDTIKQCEVANDVRDYMPKEFEDKIVSLNMADLDYLIALAWNEIMITDDMSTREKMMVSSYISGSLESFLDTVNDAKSDQERLSPRMKKYLACAVKVVMSQTGTTIKDIIECLMYHEPRHKFIDKCTLPRESMTIQELLRLDEVDKKGNVIGTRYSEISGIVDRVSILFNDYSMELMMSAPPNPEIDFTKWANEGYCVLIKASEMDFSRSTLKALITFLYSKIWLSMLARGKINQPRIAHVILDEIHNFPQICEMLKTNCREAAKYGLSYVFTSHLLKDLKSLLPYMKGSGANFMLFKTTKENFFLLKEELEMGGFEIEECMKLRDYHTINYVNYDRDYVLFTSKVIDPIEKNFTKIDRSYLDEIHSKRFGYCNVGC